MTILGIVYCFDGVIAGKMYYSAGTFALRGMWHLLICEKVHQPGLLFIKNFAVLEHILAIA